MLNLRGSLADGSLEIRQNLLVGLEILPRIGDEAQDIVIGRLQVISHGYTQILQLLRNGLGGYLIKLLLDLILNRGGAGICDLRSDRIPLLIYIIFDLRGAQGTVLDLQKIRTEGLRNHDGRIVFARFDTVNGILLIGKYPAQIVIFLHLVQDLLPRVQGTLLVLRPHVIVGYRYLDIDGIAVRVPVGRDIEPRIQRRDDTHAHRHNDRCRGFCQSRDISFENLYHFPH